MAANSPDQAKLKCLRCQEVMRPLGQFPIRTGGKSGAANFWLGDWAEWEERLIHLDVYRCSTCGHLEFFDFDLSLPKK